MLGSALFKLGGNITGPGTPMLITDGDSYMDGMYGGGGVFISDPLWNQGRTQGGFGSGDVYNLALGGSVVHPTAGSQAAAFRVQGTARVADIAAHIRQNSLNVYWLYVGTNDLGNGVSAASIASEINTHLGIVKAMAVGSFGSIKTVVTTYHNATAQRIPLNNLLLAGLSNADYLVPLHAEPTMGLEDLDLTSDTYFYKDVSHADTPGVALLAKVAGVVLSCARRGLAQPGYLVVNPSAAGVILGTMDANIALARASAGSVVALNTGFRWSWTGAQYAGYQSGMKFDYTSIPDAAPVVLVAFASQGAGVPSANPELYDMQLRSYDYGAAVDVADWRNDTQWSALPLFAHRASAGYTDLHLFPWIIDAPSIVSKTVVTSLLGTLSGFPSSTPTGENTANLSLSPAPRMLAMWEL